MIRTVVFWLVCVVLVIVLGPLFLFFAYIDRSSRLSDSLAVLWSFILLQVAGVRVRCINGEYLKRFDRYIIVANHLSYIDIFTLITLLKKVPHFLAKKELFRIPVFGTCLRAAGVIEIDRDNPDIALMAIEKALSKGLNKPIAIFPEGTRSPDGKLQPFKKRGLILLFKTGLPVIPVVFIGTREIMSKGSYKVRPGIVTVTVLEPLNTCVFLKAKQPDELISTLWENINEVVRNYYN